MPPIVVARAARWTAAALLVLAPMAVRAQDNDPQTVALMQSRPPLGNAGGFQIYFTNSTASCAWITITREVSPGRYHQVKNDGRQRLYTGPMYIAARGKYQFAVGTAASFKIRAEVAEKNCKSGFEDGPQGGSTIYDTVMLIPDTDNGSMANVVLHKGNGNYYFTR